MNLCCQLLTDANCFVSALIITASMPQLLIRPTRMITTHVHMVDGKPRLLTVNDPELLDNYRVLTILDTDTGILIQPLLQL